MEFYYPEEAMPPECRVVLVLLSHRSEPYLIAWAHLPPVAEKYPLPKP